MNDKEKEFYYIAEQVSESDKNRRKKLLLVLPESAGDIFLSTSLLQSLKEDLYPDYDIYFACYPQFHYILKNNPFLYKVINYCKSMDNPLSMEGGSRWTGFFHICIQLHILTQMCPSYHRNALDRTTFIFR